MVKWPWSLREDSATLRALRSETYTHQKIEEANQDLREIRSIHEESQQIRAQTQAQAERNSWADAVRKALRGTGA